MLGEVNPGKEPKFGRVGHFSAVLIRWRPKARSPLPALGQRGSMVSPVFLFLIIPSFHYSNTSLFPSLLIPSPKLIYMLGFSQPEEIAPLGPHQRSRPNIIPSMIYYTLANRILPNVSRGIFQIFFLSQTVIVKASLPKSSTFFGYPCLLSHGPFKQANKIYYVFVQK